MTRQQRGASIHAHLNRSGDVGAQSTRCQIAPVTRGCQVHAYRIDTGQCGSSIHTLPMGSRQQWVISPHITKAICRRHVSVQPTHRCHRPCVCTTARIGDRTDDPFGVAQCHTTESPSYPSSNMHAPWAVTQHHHTAVCVRHVPSRTVTYVTTSAEN